MPFIIAAVALLCAFVIWRFKRRNDHTDGLGWMSERWLAEQRASRQ